MNSMEQFRQSLEQLRQHGVEEKSFFIFQQLRRIVTEPLITELTASFFLDHHHKQDIDVIIRDGVRLFCILALLDQIDQLPRFLACSTLDSRLPIHEEAEFRRIAPDVNIRFYTEIQWQFFPWSFRNESTHLIFPDRTILPFIGDNILTEGSGGEISIAIIPAAQQDFYLSKSDETVKVVRKRIKEARNPEHTENMFQKERDCLELYHSLRHSHIIELLGSFTIKGKHNLLFPYFPRNLDQFFLDEPVGKFCEKATFTAAVAGLASALESVHEVNIRSRTKPIYKTSYGYHHDIRPANILVTDSTFILADFGLAYPRPQAAQEPPSTTWAENIGHYIAPECMDQNLEPRAIGRSYDIWAFGCLLSEIATYMTWGPNGIKNFRERRTTSRFHEIDWINGYYFEGRSTGGEVLLKGQVSDWLQALVKDPQDYLIPGLVALANTMLHPDPECRPSMVISSVRLSILHTKRLFRSVVELIEKTLSELGQPRLQVSPVTTTELKTELSKLKTVGDVLELNNLTQVDCAFFTNKTFAKFVEQSLEEISSAFHRFRASLPEYVRVWKTSKSQPALVKELIPLKLIDEPIRKGIRELCESLPDQVRFHDLYVKNFFASFQSQDSLQQVEDLSTESPQLYADIGLLAKLKRLGQELQRKTVDSGSTGNPDLILNWSKVEIGETFSRNHHLGVYNMGINDSYEPRKILIEWILLSQFPEGEPEDMRIQKFLELAELLQCQKPDTFRLLRCIGFLPPESNKQSTYGYGFVYPFPPGPTPADAMQPITLKQLLTTGKPAHWSISLGDKFNIAKAYSHSLGQLHRHNWLHKNIRSDNVIFFGEAKEQRESRKSTKRLNSGPYLLGLHHGRPDMQGFHSDIVSNEAEREMLLYQHPAYSYGNTPFRKAFDLYSLGIIFLEVAYWIPIQELWKREGVASEKKGGTMTSEDFQTKLVDKYVPKLAETMGNVYMNATLACLKEVLVSKEEAPETDIISQFYQDVVQKLDICNVG